MEAARASRQTRLAALRGKKEQASGLDGSATASTSASVHPFRKAISNVTTRRRRGVVDNDGNQEDGDETTGHEEMMSRLADSTKEGELLRTYRNWDPRTGQARQGAWNTVTGIEDEMRNVQITTLEQDRALRSADLDLATLAPRKPNWDLRRHLDKRLKKLEKRDKEARLILIRQRLKAASAKSEAGGVEMAAMSALNGLSASSGRPGPPSEASESESESEQD